MSYIGTNKVGKMYLGGIAIGKAYLGSDLVYSSVGGTPTPTPQPSNLPAGYTECEYIENPTKSNTGPYINTGIAATSGVRIEAKIKNSNDPKGEGYMIYGVQSQGNNLFCTASSSRPQAFSFGAYNYGASYSGSNDVAHTIVQSETKLVYDGVEYASTGTGSWTTNIDIVICGVNKGSLVTGCWAAKYYYFKIYVNDTLVRNFVPAYEESTQKYGMYDLVSETFFSSARSAQFTGTILT